MNTQSFSSGVGHCSPVDLVDIKHHYDELFGGGIPVKDSLEYVNKALEDPFAVSFAFFWGDAARLWQVPFDEFMRYSHGDTAPRVKAILRDMRTQLTAMRHG